MVRTAQSSDEFSSNKRILQMWDSCIDLRIHLQQKHQTPPPSSTIITPSTKSIITYQCDIDKARMPVCYVNFSRIKYIYIYIYILLLISAYARK